MFIRLLKHLQPASDQKNFLCISLILFSAGNRVGCTGLLPGPLHNAILLYERYSLCRNNAIVGVPASLHHRHQAEALRKRQDLPPELRRAKVEPLCHLGVVIKFNRPGPDPKSRCWSIRCLSSCSSCMPNKGVPTWLSVCGDTFLAQGESQNNMIYDNNMIKKS